MHAYKYYHIMDIHIVNELKKCGKLASFCQTVDGRDP